MNKILRGPSVPEIARRAGVGTATVDRVLNGRANVSAATATRVLTALAELRQPKAEKQRRITVLSESGDSFNRSLEDAVAAVARRRQDLAFDVHTFSSMDVRILSLAQQIERLSQGADGMILVAREDPAIVRAARAVKRRGTPVVCLATDLPESCRHAFVGSNEFGAGAAAAGLIGDLLGKDGGDVLLIVCGDYLAAKDRETGFRHVLEDLCPSVRIVERADVRNDPEIARAAVVAHIDRFGPPDAIYSIAGGNSGIGRALQECELVGQVTFVGHELNSNSRLLLKAGQMTYLIARDQEQEVMLGISVLDSIFAGHPFSAREERPARILSRHVGA